MTFVLKLVTVSNDAAYADGLLARAVEWIEHYRPDVDVVDTQIERR
jgi:hypothetical protein